MFATVNDRHRSATGAALLSQTNTHHLNRGTCRTSPESARQQNHRRAVHNTSLLMLSNSVTLTGNLGSDIELRQLPSGQTVGNVSIAVTRNYTSKAGETIQDTNWFRLVVWGQQADRMSREVGKGSRVIVEGRLTSRSYENKEGQRKDVTEIIVGAFRELARRPRTESATETLVGDQVEEPIAF